MNTSLYGNHVISPNVFARVLTRGMLAWCLAALLSFSAFAQAPVLLWSTNIGATLFAVDNQTNSYAYVAGKVIVINPNGVPVSTNVICPRPGLALRDAAGNYYFAGAMPGHTYNGFDTSFDPQDFGGIILSNKAVFLAK